MKHFGGVEAGGTKFICIIADGPEEVLAEDRFPTTSPEETFGHVINFFQSQYSLQAVGVGSFGPVDLKPGSPTFGSITSTPKPGWANTDVAGTLTKELKIPVVFDTDVNAAAYGEFCWGAAQGLTTFIYLTIGTGIGGGAMVSGNLLHGLVHSEMGHMLIPHDWHADPFPGVCPYHGDCFEGLANGPAIQARWDIPAEQLPDDHPAWKLESHYISLALANLILAFSPERLILGGGVMQHQQLFPRLWEEVPHLLNGYVRAHEVIEQIESYIVPPGLGTRAGVLGATALAMHLNTEVS